MVPFWGRCTTHFVYFSGDWEWDFEAWPRLSLHLAQAAAVRGLRPELVPPGARVLCPVGLAGLKPQAVAGRGAGGMVWLCLVR